MGAGADVLKYRFQWNFPIFFSPHDPKKLYCAGNALFATVDEGASWKQLSPDLTTNDKARQYSSGGPITKDNTSVEYYCTIFTAMESPLEKDHVWTGSDDGLVYFSKDGGANWSNVTPKGIPQWMMWNAIEADPFKKGLIYITGTRYKLDDYTPYIYKTEDYGQTWQLITNGIPSQHFTRVMRADHKRPGLLYAGTEFGMYVSYDGGGNWHPFQLNLPITPITDLTIKNNDLVVATQGRSLWILDDLSMVQQLDPAFINKNMHVYQMNDAYRIPGVSSRWGAPSVPANSAMNPPKGAVVNYWVKTVTDSTNASITIVSPTGKVIKKFATGSKENPLTLKRGFNQFVWDLKYPEAEKADGLILWNGTPSGITAAPGKYTAHIQIGGDSTSVTFNLLADPNYKCTQADYEAQVSFLLQVQDKFNETMKAIKKIKSTREQLTGYSTRLGKTCPAALKNLGDSLSKRLTAIEELLHQTKAKSGQDVLNYPIRLDDKLSGVFDMANSGNMAPPKQALDVFSGLATQVDAALAQLQVVLGEGLQAFNKMIVELRLPVIVAE
jgi:hypothetical protein